MTTWNPRYLTHVLAPDYHFASTHLKRHFVNALTAHVRTVRRLSDPHIQRHQDAIGALEDKLITLHTWSTPRYDPEIPDLYFAINRELEASLGSATVSFLRMGLSRNDLDMTVYKMRARDLLLELAQQACTLQRVVLDQAEAHTQTVLIAHTHHQPGQPTTLAHYLLAVSSGLSRNLDRLLEVYARLNTCPLGAAALAGSSHALDRHFTARALGFDGPVSNTYDAVAASDWQVDIVNVSQQFSLTCSRFVCDLLGWASQDLYRLSDGLVQGSSIMPQKRNPVALEHARTRFSRALGASQMVIFSSHNIPFGDLNDFGPDIQGALQALFLQLSGGLDLLAASLETGTFDAAALERLTRESDTMATELADELVREHDMAFQSAHHLVARLVADLEAQGRVLKSATPEDIVKLEGPRLKPDELNRALDPRAFIERRNGVGGPAPEVVYDQLTHAQSTLDSHTTKFTEAAESLLQTEAALSRRS